MSLLIDPKASPMMGQWQKCKARAKEALLLFRLGDFYEAFYEDAHILASTLDLTLTQRQNIPMSGIPAHSLEGYLDKLIAKGLLVAIAEQMEEAQNTKGIVKRDITRIISPATHIPSDLQANKGNQFFAAVQQVNQRIGLCFLDLTTGEASVVEVETIRELLDELSLKQPKEILSSQKFVKQYESALEELKSLFPFRLTMKEEWLFDHKTAYKALIDHFQVHNLDGFGLGGMVSAINAAGALFYYLDCELSQKTSHIKTLKVSKLTDFVSIDYRTMRHLDILFSSSGDSTASLLFLLDETKTPMGQRLLKRWITHPLLSVEKIAKRANGVEELLSQTDKFASPLKEIRDLERLAMRIETGYANPKDLIALSTSLKAIPEIWSLLSKLKSPCFSDLLSSFSDFSPLVTKIDSALVENPPTKISEGGLFRPGYSRELDEIRSLREDSQEWLQKYQSDLRESLGIKNLKVTFNRAFGYFIEVSNSHLEKMPSSFQRKQTLVNNERYISPELREYEHKILTAEDKILSLEYEAFLSLREEIAKETRRLFVLSRALAKLDCLLSLAIVAKQNQYVRPLVNSSDRISITAGRHPILEKRIGKSSFIANDLRLDGEEKRLYLITGPNMAGKSTYIRQAALLTIMAQIGSFVPAEEAEIGIVDKVFTRIGASDDLARGQSTFMVEMTETASILNNATKRSLVILDEIGRGTSTYDGIAIAWAVAEHLLNVIGAKTLFATHFWELTKLEKEHKGAQNLRVAVQENEDGIIFLHKILKGDTDKSYGIHVAKLAGLPSVVTLRAAQFLANLEQKKPLKKKPHPQQNDQFLLFSEIASEENKILAQIKALDINTMTPLEALELLAKFKNEL